MRVLHLIDSLSVGGAEKSLVASAPLLRESGVELHVATLSSAAPLAPQLAGHVDSITTGLGAGRRGGFKALNTLLQRLEPNVVHTTLFEANLLGAMAGRRIGIPVMASLVSAEFGRAHYRTPGHHPHKVVAAHGAAVGMARMVKTLHAVSESVADHMAGRLMVKRSRIHVVPRGRNAVALGERSSRRRADIRRQLGLDAETRVVLCVARHDYAKGLDVAVSAVSRVRKGLPGVVLLIAGPAAAETQRLEQLIQEEGLEDAVRLLGERDDVAELMCGADVLCFPSRREGMPGTLLEAMALELPIVASNLPSIREVMGSEPRLIPVNDQRSFGDAMIDQIVRPPAAMEVSLRARFLSTYTIEASAVGIAALYQKTAGA